MPLVISHRGANRVAPENTLPAFEAALKLRVDGFENDVHMTRDGVAVVCHDDTVDRTSDGSGRICDMALEELRALDFGAWFSPAFAGTRIPTLEEFFALCGGCKVLNVEIKRAADGSTAIAAEVIRLAKAMGVFPRLIVSSFEMDMLKACLDCDPAARVCFLYGPGSALCEEIVDDPVAFARRHRLHAFHPFMAMVSKDYIDRCHGAGVVVNPWTVNQVHALAALRDWGADGIITDLPELAMEVVYGES
jgi:glycerophosphoryl diester phosphodiesterase